MLIRKAVFADAVPIAKLLYLATGEVIYSLIGKEDEQKALDFLLHFTAIENNQYSYQNCWVIEGEKGDLLAAAAVYPGANLHALREPVLNYIAANYGKLSFTLEDETEPGEYYVDSIGVDPSCQGKGLGTLLLKFLIKEYVIDRKEPLGLLVDESNPGAKRLYLSLGFEVIKPVLFTGKPMEHLQIIP